MSRPAAILIFEPMNLECRELNLLEGTSVGLERDGSEGIRDCKS